MASVLSGVDVVLGKDIKMKFLNFTPHDIVMNDGARFMSEGVARVDGVYSAFDENGICRVDYGGIVGLPRPENDVVYIVSTVVLGVARLLGRSDVVAPATGHPDCIRKDGHVVSVPGFIR